MRNDEIFQPHEYREIYLCSQNANHSFRTRLNISLRFTDEYPLRRGHVVLMNLYGTIAARILPVAELTVLYQRVAAQRRPVGDAELGDCGAVAAAQGETREHVADVAVAVLPRGNETARAECDSAVRRPGDRASEMSLSRRQSRRAVRLRQRRCRAEAVFPCLQADTM